MIQRSFDVMRPRWAGLDLAVVVLFVGIGRSAHDHGVHLRGMVSTTWPFACGLLVAWLVLAARRRDGAAVVSGLFASAVTVSVGMVIRVAAGQGTAVAFVLVATVFLGTFMMGWRMLRSRWRQRMARHDS